MLFHLRPSLPELTLHGFFRREWISATQTFPNPMYLVFARCVPGINDPAVFFAAMWTNHLYPSDD